MNKEAVLISACLLGVHCRYDGKCQNIKEFDQKLPLLMEKYQLIPVCSEVYGGLTTPRDPAEIVNGRVMTKSGQDVTEAFDRGAKEVLGLAELYHCNYVILKKRSPSCGHTEIYDGTFSSKLTQGNGRTAQLLIDHGIRVIGEDEVDQLL